MTSWATVLLLSTVLNLSTLESESRRVISTRTVLGRVERGTRRVGVWFPTSLVKLTNELNGSRASFLCVISNRYNQNCAQVPYRFKGRKSAGMCAVAADLHDTTQGVHHKFSCIRPAFFTDPHFEGGWKWIEAVCMWFLTSVLNLITELNASRCDLLRWWNRRMRPYRWMPKMSPVAQSGCAWNCALTSMFSKGRKSRPYTATMFQGAFSTFLFPL